MKRHPLYYTVIVVAVFAASMLATGVLIFAAQSRVEQAIALNQSSGPGESPDGDLKNKPTAELIENLGAGAYSARTLLKIELGRRFRDAASAERKKIHRFLIVAVGSASQSEKRADAASRLAGFINLELSVDEKEQISDGLRETIRTTTDPTVALFMVRALPDLDQSEKAISAVLGILDKQELLKKGPELRNQVFFSVGRMGERAVPYLLNSLNKFPEAVMMALAFTKSKQALRILQESARSNDAEFRYHAIHALGLWGSSENIPVGEKYLIQEALTRASRDPDEDVRNKAAEMIDMVASRR